MLILKLVSKDEDSVTYHFYPENRLDAPPGYITVQFSDLKCTKAKKADPDENMWYLHHALARVRENIKNNHFPESEMVAWY
ncbi:hypothetical protein [Staphylococcus intermedius]|uniref:hypothetical protein n=1 Tax=Staphylococcus intermedius TaxID=1285 RepID=UPI000380A105|nr:hypothetical protein [Staphylococcus intermedius]PCF65004.1 hypothetical protein B5C04_02840 [Staphylococcus intermedius]PCF80615.1 hypothetical protein B4W74_02860 [Staphylococcus intermedius]PCF81964.1 hypothetical protein B4W70_02840 [Staphylococcus intermedius]PCF88300.1 hypothetical protein B4W75_05885 [Staphylococcus intermedius]PCF89015.1 hypothetical protein B4W76_01880 [Staphylococcus intermedius]